MSHSEEPVFANHCSIKGSEVGVEAAELLKSEQKLVTELLKFVIIIVHSEN